MTKNLLRSIAAILAGFIAGAALSVGTDSLLQALGIFPPQDEGFFIPWMIVLAIVYRSTYNVFGCYFTAALAPKKPMLHVMVIGVVGLILTVIGTLMHADNGPLWYGISLAILTLPSAWLGATLRMKSHNVESVTAV
jgi:hypothetical protein